MAKTDNNTRFVLSLALLQALLKEVEVSVKLSAHFLDINIDNVPMVVKDVENMICLISGVDYMAKVRSNLGE
ncbi:phage major tail tube protein [Campylobacter sp. 7477a]|uniref:phage major tail tube protein n=1 Tax=Campylobacter sp. 7477a TaxID=2735741 RepID=UPI0030151E3F|nr:phage major tail tube protein [Campylobacter sp. 7477a]